MLIRRRVAEPEATPRRLDLGRGEVRCQTPPPLLTRTPRGQDGGRRVGWGGEACAEALDLEKRREGEKREEEEEERKREGDAAAAAGAPTRTGFWPPVSPRASGTGVLS